jgi:peroxiredoxin
MAKQQTKLRLLAVSIVAAVLLAACGGGSSDSNDSGFGLTDWPEGGKTGAAPGDLAPNFRLEAPDGTTIELASYTGQPIVVNFLATWCANCMEEMDALRQVHAQGVTVVGVNLRESAETVTKLVADSQATFPIALDRDGKVTRAYKVVNLPGTAVLKPDGTVSTVIRGPITVDSLLDAVNAARGG